MSVAVDPSTHAVYVGDNEGNGFAGTVSVIDGTTDTLTHMIVVSPDVDAVAGGLAVDSSTHQVFVAVVDNTLASTTPNSAELPDTGEGDAGPLGGATVALVGVLAAAALRRRATR